jgi:hypothetical protein
MILLAVVNDAISKKQTVAFESTMSGLMWRKMINDFDNSSDRAKLVVCREAGAPEVILEQEIWNHYQRLV